jgi:subtilisin family serine protease
VEKSMNKDEYKKFLTIFSIILVSCFTIYTFAPAQDLSTVMKKENVHPKLETNLAKLEQEYENSAAAAQVFAHSKKIKIEDQKKITVYMISEPGASIDKDGLEFFGAAIIKSVDNVAKVKVPINMLKTIADKVKGISFIKLPKKLVPSAIQTEGVGLTGATSFHLAGYTGNGVKVAVIDVGFANLSVAISEGELPNNTVMVDCTGSSCGTTDFSSETEKHGTAVAEIIYDMAPDAQLYLIKIEDTLDLWDAKDYSINNGINIINHSLLASNTNFYDGECYFLYPVCTANDAYNQGILWVNAAGNEAAKHYEATFTDSDSDGRHDELINITAKAGDFIKVYLTWDAWPITDQDYDLYLYDSSLKEVASSLFHQTGTQDPSEEIVYSVGITDTYSIMIYKYSASSDHRLELYSELDNLTPSVTSSSLLNPADAAGAMTVGAIDYLNWTTGPQEYYSSQGPTNDGRIKPDISGPDFVSNYVYGFFPGTSAACAHVTGAAALILSKNQTYSVSELWYALTSSATDMGSVGKDNIYGFGRLNLDVTGSNDGGSSGGSGDGCFIATAAFGSPIDPHVKRLREFRDRFLLNNKAGKVFVNLYNKYSPPMAEFIDRHENLRKIVQLVLIPLVGVSWIVLKIGSAYAIVLILLLGFGIISLIKFIKILPKEK